MTVDSAPGGQDGTRREELEALAAAVLWGEGQPARPDALRTQSFIRLGGDSLRAMRLCAMAQDRLRVAVPLGLLMGDEPLSVALSRAAPSTLAGDGAADPAVSSSAPSRIQQGMWAAQRVMGGAPYNLVFTAFIDGPLRPDLLRQAIGRTVARHEGLRTVFPEAEGRLERRVEPSFLPEVATVADERVGDAGFAGFVRAVAAEQGRRPLDLGASPPLRFLLAAHGAGHHALIMVVHHMLLDGWAIGLVLKEIFAHYDAMERGGALRLGPAKGIESVLRDTERLRTTGVLDQQAAFWERHLDGVPTVLDLPADRPRPQFQDPAGARIRFDAGPAATERVTERARGLGITPFAFLLGAYGLTLSRYTGAQSLLVGVLLAGRTSSELEALVAVAGNLLPVRIDVDDDDTVAGYLQAVHRSVARSLEHGSIPFDDLVSRLGAGGGTDRHPLVQVAFGMHDQLVPWRLGTATLDVRVEEGHGGGSQFDLTLFVRERDPSYAGDLEFATSVWRTTEAEAFLADYRAAVQELTADLGAPLERVRCIAPSRRPLLEALNDTASPYPETSAEALFEARVRAAPDAIALREEGRQLTYAELAHAAGVQARLLADAGVTPGDYVLIGLDRSIAEAVALLGVLWAGATYVGVEPSLPRGRVEQIVSRLAPAAAIGAVTPGGRFGSVALVESWDEGWRDQQGVREPVAPADPDRIAYVAFTSGSTGVPKGVCVPHRGIVRLVHGVDYVRLGPHERVLRFSPLAFDASTLEVWGALLTGATLEIHPAGLPAPAELAEFIARQGVTVAWLTSGLFRLVVEFAPAALGGLGQLLTGGDVVPSAHVERLLSRHAGLVVTNGYGPTENTTFTTVHSVADPAAVGDPLPIGRPIPNTRVYILDQRRRLVPPGGIGELYAAGAGLATGYLNDEEETARRFGRLSPEVDERLYWTGDLVRLDSDGRIQFLGRRDDQVKVRGYRIELSEISTTLTKHPAVHDAVVIATGTGSDDKRLLAACVPASDPPDLEDLRDFLAARLPGYMVPTLWAVVDHVPMTQNGKTDRRALEAAAKPLPAATPPPSGGDAAVEDQVATLMAEVVGRDDIDADEDFFAAGGDSLRAINLIGLVQDRLGVAVSLRDFLKAPTLSALTRLVEHGHATADR